MKEYVFMTQRGDLLVGMRVSFLDKPTTHHLDSLEGYSVGLWQHDGWIIYHPVIEQNVYFNRSIEELLIPLGEL
jgi:hypothetical protein